MIWVSPSVINPRTGSRVVCGLGETMARLSPTSALSSVLLPAFGRPARATIPQRVIPEYRPGTASGAERQQFRRRDEQAGRFGVEGLARQHALVQLDVGCRHVARREP